MCCDWNGAYRSIKYGSIKKHKLGWVVLEGCSEWKEPKLAWSICPLGVNTLYPDSGPNGMSWLAPEEHSSVC